MKRTLGVALCAVLLCAPACSDRGAAAPQTEGRLRIGYFPNVTHAPAIVGLERGIFQEHLGPDVELETATFGAGGEAVQALLSDAIDVAYLGPNPAINAWAQTKGKGVRLIAGTTSGGAFLVVRKGITSPQDLRGTKLSSPALGNTQDVALRAWLEGAGLKTNVEGGGDVSIQPQENAQILETFRSGAIDGAWVPEPWATRLIEEADAHVLVDERELWPRGRFVTTHVLASSRLLEDRPELLARFLEGHVAAVDATVDDPVEAQQTVIDAIEKVTGATISTKIIAGAWKNLEFTVDPIASSLERSAKNATEAGLLDPVDLEGIYDLKPLNAVLDELGRAEVSE